MALNIQHDISGLDGPGFCHRKALHVPACGTIRSMPMVNCAKQIARKCAKRCKFSISADLDCTLSRVNEVLHRDARWLDDSTTVSVGAKDLSECKAVINDDFNPHDM